MLFPPTFWPTLRLCYRSYGNHIFMLGREIDCLINLMLYLYNRGSLVLSQDLTF